MNTYPSSMARTQEHYYIISQEAAGPSKSSQKDLKEKKSSRCHRKEADFVFPTFFPADSAKGLLQQVEVVEAGKKCQVIKQVRRYHLCIRLLSVVD